MEEKGKNDAWLLENDDSPSAPNVVSRIGATVGALSAARAASSGAARRAGDSHALAVLVLCSMNAWPAAHVSSSSATSADWRIFALAQPKAVANGLA